MITTSYGNPSHKLESPTIKGAAIEMKSTWVIITMAAASIFTGSFDKVAGTGGELTFGRSFQGFPTKMTGYYAYTPAKISNAKANPGNLGNGDMDYCSIYIALCTKRYELSTNTKVLFDPDDATVLAYGELFGNSIVGNMNAPEGKDAYENLVLTYNIKKII